MDHKIFECEDFYVKFSSCFMKLLGVQLNWSDETVQNHYKRCWSGNIYRTSLFVKAALALLRWFLWTIGWKTLSFVGYVRQLWLWKLFELSAIVFLHFQPLFATTVERKWTHKIMEMKFARNFVVKVISHDLQLKYDGKALNHMFRA